MLCTYVQVHRWADGNGADLRLTDMYCMYMCTYVMLGDVMLM